MHKNLKEQTVRKRFSILLIKPSRYDDEGYVVQWRRAIVPAHGVASVWGLIEEAAEQQILGPDVEIEVNGLDEITSVINPPVLLKQFKKPDRILVMMVGVQTNQFPRAVDLGKRFIAEGASVAIGGYHVSGILALTPDWEVAGLKEAQAEGISLFAGELESGIVEFLTDAWAGQLKPLYDKRDDLADMTLSALPKLLTPAQRKLTVDVAGMDMGRGCPFKCTFCSVINVFGNKMRARSPEDIEVYLRRCIEQGTEKLLVIDDNFARLHEWESLLDVFIKLRKETGVTWDFFMQIDTQSHRIPGFVEKSKAAGCTRVFIGVESVRDNNLQDAGKKHNKVKALHDMAMAWKEAGIFIFGTLIVGFPNDTPESMREDIKFIQDEVPIDILITTVLTPLPGSMDHRDAVRDGVVLDPDLNLYDTTHAVIEHPLMSRQEWSDTYPKLVEWYYTPEHIERIFMRAIKYGISETELARVMQGFYGGPRYEQTHPYVYGVLRRKIRRDRRPGMAIEPIWRFYPRRLWEVSRSIAGQLRLMAHLRLIIWRARRAVARGTTVT